MTAAGAPLPTPVEKGPPQSQQPVVPNKVVPIGHNKVRIEKNHVMERDLIRIRLHWILGGAQLYAGATHTFDISTVPAYSLPHIRDRAETLSEQRLYKSSFGWVPVAHVPGGGAV